MTSLVSCLLLDFTATVDLVNGIQEELSKIALLPPS
jgi:hypothetical protein